MGERHCLDHRGSIIQPDISRMQLVQYEAGGERRDLHALPWGDGGLGGSGGGGGESEGTILSIVTGAPILLRDELQRACRHYHVSPRDLLWHWDRNRNGLISRHEVRVEIR